MYSGMNKGYCFKNEYSNMGLGGYNVRELMTLEKITGLDYFLLYGILYEIFYKNASWDDFKDGNKIFEALIFMRRASGN
jgi:hypothetical protein